MKINEQDQSDPSDKHNVLCESNINMHLYFPPSLYLNIYELFIPDIYGQSESLVFVHTYDNWVSIFESSLCTTLAKIQKSSSTMNGA